jgi:hypothetical protein
MADEKEKDYSTKWLAVSEPHPLGAGWYVQVGIIEDPQGGRKVRVARGKASPQGGITQQQRFNLKAKEWPWIREQIEKYLAQLTETGEEKE